MNNGFWGKLNKPIFALAPMADVTDPPFRRIIAKYGKFTRPDGALIGGPDVFWTEFVSADGLVSKGREVLLKDLEYSENERPIIAQLFTSSPLKMEEAAKIVQDLGFDGLDINMGCPDRTIEKQGAGAALIRTPYVAREVIKAAKRGAPNLPISAKTRVGYRDREIETWILTLLKEGLSVLSIHARTREEMSKVPARWEDVKRIVEIRNEISKETLIFGNGDVLSLKDAKEKIEVTGADGAMLGKAIFGNPWLFSKKREVTVSEKLIVAIEHTKLFEEILGKRKSFSVMKKHFKAYVEGFSGAKDLRGKLMETNSSKEVERIILDFLKSNKEIAESIINV